MSHLIAGLLLAMTVAPSDTAPKRHPAAQIAAAEIAFAQQSVSDGLNTAFAANFADHAVGFAPEPRENARADFVGRPNPPVLLDWYPAYVLAAASGDFGLSTGPSVLTFDDGSRPPRHGHYISIWERQPDGAWKVTIDGGSGHAEPPSPIPRLDPVIMPPNQLSAPAGWAGTDIAVLLEAERNFSRLSETRGMQQAFALTAAKDVRFYRHGQLPVTGRAAALEALEPLAGKWTWQPQGGRIARSGDLGFTYGISTRMAEEGDERGAYLRVWQRNADGWQVILSRDNPLPPAS